MTRAGRTCWKKLIELLHANTQAAEKRAMRAIREDNRQRRASR